MNRKEIVLLFALVFLGQLFDLSNAQGINLGSCSQAPLLENFNISSVSISKSSGNHFYHFYIIFPLFEVSENLVYHWRNNCAIPKHKYNMPENYHRRNWPKYV